MPYDFRSSLTAKTHPQPEERGRTHSGARWLMHNEGVTGQCRNGRAEQGTLSHCQTYLPTTALRPFFPAAGLAGHLLSPPYPCWTAPSPPLLACAKSPLPAAIARSSWPICMFAAELTTPASLAGTGQCTAHVTQRHAAPGAPGRRAYTAALRVCHCIAF